MAWATTVGAHWEKIEAEYNAEWAKLAYLDGPGYTAWDRIEAKSELHRKYFSRSSSHGAVNSPTETLTQPIELHFTSSIAESNQQSKLSMAEYGREIRESCARILKLLQEINTTESESTEDAVLTSDDTFLSMEPIDASESMTVALLVSKDSLPSKESTESSIVSDEDPVVHRLSPRREIPITQISKSLNHDTRSDEIGVSALPYMTMGGNVVSLPLFGEGTHSFAADASLVCTYPYDPGPLDSPSLNTVSNIRDSFQLEVLIQTLSKFDDPIALQVFTKLKNNSNRNAKFLSRAFFLPFPVCPILFSIISVGEFFGCGSSASDAHLFSIDTYQLFVEMPLKTTFHCNIVLFHDINIFVPKLQTISLEILNLTLDSVLLACENFESLIMGTQSLDSFVQDYIEISVECKALYYGYFIGFAFELSFVVVGLTMLVDNIKFSLYSSVVDSFGYSASGYGYMSVHFSYSVVLIEVLFGKQPTEKIIKSLIIIGCCFPSIQNQQVFFSTYVLPCDLIWVCLSKSLQLGSNKTIVHDAFTHMALIVGDMHKLEYLVSSTYLVTCVSFLGFNDGSCWKLIQLVILVDSMMVLEILFANKVPSSALVEIFLYVRYRRHVTIKNLLPVGDCAAQSIASPIYNGCTLSLLGLEDMLQQLQKLAPEPYHVHLLSYYMHEVVGLISFSATNCVVAATIEGLLLAMTLSLAFNKRFSNVGILYWAFKLSGNHGNITCTTPSIFVGNSIFHSFVAYVDNIIYAEIHCYDFSTMVDICDIRPWTIIDLTINLCKTDVVMDAKSHTKSFYEDVHVYRFFCFDPGKLIPLTADRRVVWVREIIRSVSSAQRPDSPPVKILHFHQWDPGKILLSICKVNLIFDTTLKNATEFMKTCLHHNLEDKVDFNGGSNVMIQISI